MGTHGPRQQEETSAGRSHDSGLVGRGIGEVAGEKGGAGLGTITFRRRGTRSVSDADLARGG